MDKHTMIEALAEKARAAIQSGLAQVNTIGDDIRMETHILNAQWEVGKYCAYMDILKGLDKEFDLKTWVAVTTETWEDRDTISRNTYKIYDRG